MELKHGRYMKLTVCLYEMFAAALLIIIINWGCAYKNKEIINLVPLTVVSGVGTIIILVGKISAAHFNPSVTIGILIQLGLENIYENIFFATLIIIFQFIGGFLGAFIAFQAIDIQNNGNINPGIFILCPTQIYKGL